MKNLTLFLILLFCYCPISGQKNISLLFNVAQTNNHFDFVDITGEVYPFAPRLNYATSEQIGLSTRIENKNNVFFEFMVSGAYGSSLHSNGAIHPKDSNFKSYKQEKLDAHIRLEVGKMFTHSSLPKLTFGISGSIDPRFTYRDYLPSQTTLYEIKVQTYEFAFNINPQIEININDRLAFTLKMPLELVNYLLLKGHSHNPSQNLQDQMISNEIVDLFFLRPNYSIGIGYYLANRNRGL